MEKWSNSVCNYGVKISYIYPRVYKETYPPGAEKK